MSVIRYLTRKLNLSETKQAIIENLYWSVMGKVVTLLSGLIVGIIVARYLGPEKYGLMNYVISYVFLFHIFAVFGLDAIEIREEARKAESYQKIIGTAFTLKVAFALVFMVLTILTSWLMDGNPYTTLLIAIYSLTIALNAFNVIRNYFLAIVQNEYPQTIALILSYLSASQAAMIVSALPPERQADVAKRVAMMDRTSPDIIREVEREAWRGAFGQAAEQRLHGHPDP